MTEGVTENADPQQTAGLQTVSLVLPQVRCECLYSIFSSLTTFYLRDSNILCIQILGDGFSCCEPLLRPTLLFCIVSEIKSCPLFLHMKTTSNCSQFFTPTVIYQNYIKRGTHSHMCLLSPYHIRDKDFWISHIFLIVSEVHCVFCWFTDLLVILDLSHYRDLTLHYQRNPSLVVFL